MYQFYQWLKQVHRILRILSLDVVLGAVAQAYLWAYVLRVEIPIEIYVALGLSVWLIYTLDHLLDAYKIPHDAHTARHRFHQKHFYSLVFCWCLGAVLGLWLASGLPWRLWLYGGGMLCLMAFHFFLSFRVFLSKKLLLFQKETRIAVFYSLGVSLGALSALRSEGMHLPIIWTFGMVFGLAWLNLLLISYHEAETDSRDGQASIAGDVGLGALQLLIHRLSVSVGAFWLCGFLALDASLYGACAVLGLMWLTLELVRRFPWYFKERERYRIWSDLVFLYPYSIYFLMNGTGF